MFVVFGHLSRVDRLEKGPGIFVRFHLEKSNTITLFSFNQTLFKMFFNAE